MDTAIQRKNAAYQNLSQDYLVKSRDYTKQYAHLCSQRLIVLREVLKKKAVDQFGPDVPIFQLFELTVGVKCILIGTLFKEMELKPNILKELGDEYGFVAQPVRDRYVSSTDHLILEDELQQVKLTGDIDANLQVTGAVVACYGYESESNRGHFNVENIVYPVVDIPTEINESLTEEKSVLFISGLEFATSKCDHIPNLHLLFDWINGSTMSSSKQTGLMRSTEIARVVIAGNSLSQSVHERDYLSKAKYLTKKAAVPTAEPMSALDTQLALLTGSVNVDLMPGETDPANLFWPQQPMIRSMFPLAARGGGLCTVTNPYAFVVDGVHFLVTSGQNISDILKYSKVDDPLEAMELTLKLRLLAPTAPDTLPCYPFIDKDPFLITQTPHVYVCTNLSDKVRTKWFYPSNGDDKQGILMVSVPSFAKCKTAVIVRLNKLGVTEFKME